jgi:PAS domain S-box-containing protein
MEEASDGILVYDAEGKFISVNNKIVQMLGYSPEEMARLDLYSITPEEDRILQPLKFNKLKKGESLLTERLMKRKDGVIFPVEVSSKKINDNTYQSFIRDITERKISEEIIKRSEAELNALFHALPDLIIVFDKDGVILRISSNIPGLNYPAGSDITGKNIFDVLPYPEASFIHKNILKAISPNGSTLHTEQFIEKDGKKIWLNITISPMPEEKVVWVARDISIRKRAEEELTHSKNYLDKIINTIPEPVFVKDQNHRWILLNDALCEYLGIAREKLIGKTDIDVFPPEKAEIFLEKDKLVFETGLDDILEEELADSRGFVHTIIMKKSLYHDPQRGKLLVGIINDISARKKIEQKLQNQNEELIKINAELDKFVYRASHDLRAPLVSILGLINIAKMENNPEKNPEYFALMEKSINKLDNFIQSIIHYSRNSRLELQIDEIDFNKLITEAFDDLKYIESSKKIDIKVDINEKVPFYSDVFRLKIIFNNIISNAIRYYNSRQDFPYLLIKIETDETKSVIQFEDNGIGIAEESVGRIFEMFYRASETNVGSGLGLYIVKDVVDTMKGTIEVKSRLGHGTNFIFTIPNSKPSK